MVNLVYTHMKRIILSWSKFRGCCQVKFQCIKLTFSISRRCKIIHGYYMHLSCQTVLFKKWISNHLKIIENESGFTRVGTWYVGEALYVWAIEVVAITVNVFDITFSTCSAMCSSCLWLVLSTSESVKGTDWIQM